MATLDKFIDVMYQQGASSMRLASGSAVMLDVEGADRAVTKDLLTKLKIMALVREIAPDGMKDHEVPVLWCQLQQRPHSHDAGVVDQDIEPAESVDDAIDHRRALLGLAHVHSKRIGGPAQRANFLGHGLSAGLVEIHHGHRCALASVSERHRSSNPTAAARNHCDTSIQSAHVILPVSVPLCAQRCLVRQRIMVQRRQASGLGTSPVGGNPRLPLSASGAPGPSDESDS